MIQAPQRTPARTPPTSAPPAPNPPAPKPPASTEPASTEAADHEPPADEPPSGDEPTGDEPPADEPTADEPTGEEPPPGPSQAGEAQAGEPRSDERRGDGSPAEQEPVPESVPLSELTGILTALTSLGDRVDQVAAAASELARLRTRDTDLIARLHDDVTKLRSGEIAAALNPIVTGMIKLHDQMVSLGALSDPASPVGMLHTQLLQTMELTCAVTPFSPEVGERFDAARHTGTRRIPTTDASADGTIAGTIKVGFARADGSIVRVAEVEVHRLAG